MHLPLFHVEQLDETATKYSLTDCSPPHHLIKGKTFAGYIIDGIHRAWCVVPGRSQVSIPKTEECSHLVEVICVYLEAREFASKIV